MKKLSPGRLAWAALMFLVVSSLVLTGCEPQGAAVRSPIPTPVGASFASPLPMPTRADGKPERQPPQPNRKVHVGEITKLEAPVATTRYLIRNELDERMMNALYVRDTQTGQEIRLGDDNGEALFEAQSDQYIIWRYNCCAEGKNSTLKTGLYASDPKSGNLTEVVQGRFQGFVEIDGQWMTYMNIQEPKAYFADLRAHNLATGEDFLVARNVAYRGVGNDYTAIGDNRIVWVGLDLNAHTVAIYVYDLATRTTRALKAPYLLSPTNVSISGDFVIWQDEFWEGYDLKQDILFGLPTVPPGWEKIEHSPAQSFRVMNDRLYWSVEVSGKTYHFTAPIVRNN